MVLNDFDPKEYGIQENYLYEILATTFSDQENLTPNTSCMGMRLIENNLIQIKPFPHTTTFKNLKTTGIIVLNFVEDVYLYALAALKSSKNNIKFPSKHYNYNKLENPFNTSINGSKMTIPYISKAWATITCIIAGENQVIKKDPMGEFEISEFKLHVIDHDILKNSFKLFNRTENLALESIILATRLRIAKEKSNETLFDDIHDAINNNFQNIERFGNNKSALKAVKVIKIFIENL